jgi:hypothetical protein
MSPCSGCRCGHWSARCSTPRPLLAPDNRLPARGIAAFILTVVALNALAWLRFVIPDLGGDPPGFLDGTGLTTNPIYVQDLAVWLPALAIVAVLLWQRRPSGVFLAGAGLVFWEIEAIGVAVDQWFGHRAAPTSDVATLGGVVLFVVLAGATLVPLILWLRAVQPGRGKSRGPSSTGWAPPIQKEVINDDDLGVPERLPRSCRR